MPAGQHSERAVGILSRGLYPIWRLLFRIEIHGVENLPGAGPYMLVANHNAGIGFVELFGFGAIWAKTFGSSRPLAGFAHPIGFRIWPITQIHREVGTVPSTYEAAYETIANGVPLLVFPGGDHETLRPVWQANRVDFGDRRGWSKIAAQTMVPVVPMGIRGSHYTCPMLWRARWIAWVLVVPRAMGIKRWGLSLTGVLGALGLAALPLPWWGSALAIWLWLGSPFIFWPIVPWKVTFHIGEPLPPFAEAPTVYARTLSAVQAQVTPD